MSYYPPYPHITVHVARAQALGPYDHSQIYHLSLEVNVLDAAQPYTAQRCKF
jgi:hypothetical protein